MIECVRVQGLHDGDVIRHSGEVRHEFGDFGAGFAVAREFELGTEQFGIGIDEGRAVALEQFRWWQFPIPFRQFGFVIEQF